MATAPSQPDRDVGPGGVRREPFSKTRIAARGQRTQQRIVDAALRVFRDDGYHRGSIDRIATLGGCSRVAFYQYFASKEDVFDHLAAQVARQLAASTDALDPITSDRAGWEALRAWVARYAQTYTRYRPVFNAHQAAVDSDAATAGVRARLVEPTLPERDLDTIVALLLECVTHIFDVAGVLGSVAPEAYAGDRIEIVITDAVHRTLFGAEAGVNVHAPREPRPPRIDFAGDLDDLLRGTDVRGSATRQALLAAGLDVFRVRGYHATRIDDVAAVAGVSRAAFYRYFRDKSELARVLHARALRGIGTTLTDIPQVVGTDATLGRRRLRRWLRRYHSVHAGEAAMLRVWVDGALEDPQLRGESAPSLDWGRRRLSAYLQPRGFGDADLDAIVMVALLGVFGARPRPASGIDAAANIIERGLLGR